jgi:hypothetical protein
LTSPGAVSPERDVRWTAVEVELISRASRSVTRFVFSSSRSSGGQASSASGITEVR